MHSVNRGLIGSLASDKHCMPQQAYRYPNLWLLPSIAKQHDRAVKIKTEINFGQPLLQ